MSSILISYSLTDVLFDPLVQELSSLSVEPCEGESILVTVFEISVNEVSKT